LELRQRQAAPPGGIFKLQVPVAHFVLKSGVAIGPRLFRVLRWVGGGEPPRPEDPSRHSFIPLVRIDVERGPQTSEHRCSGQTKLHKGAALVIHGRSPWSESWASPPGSLGQRASRKIRNSPQ